LTFEQFRRFHETLYHPSNALICIYGDIPTEEHLRFLAPVLDAFDRRPVAIATPRQPRWTSPRRIEDVYPVGPGEPLTARAFLALN